MTLGEFRTFLDKLLAYFNKGRDRIAGPDVVMEWHRAVSDIPQDRLEIALAAIKSEEKTLPQNIPMAVRKYAFLRKPSESGEPDQREYRDCPDCDGRGMIHVGRESEHHVYGVYVFRCLACHQADGVLAAQGRRLDDLLRDGWAVDNVASTIARKPKHAPGAFMNPLILAARERVKRMGEQHGL